jgi:hypothetical protein
MATVVWRLLDRCPCGVGGVLGGCGCPVPVSVRWLVRCSAWRRACRHAARVCAHGCRGERVTMAVSDRRREGKDLAFARVMNAVRAGGALVERRQWMARQRRVVLVCVCDQATGRQGPGQCCAVRTVLVVRAPRVNDGKEVQSLSLHSCKGLCSWRAVLMYVHGGVHVMRRAPSQGFGLGRDGVLGRRQ